MNVGDILGTGTSKVSNKATGPKELGQEDFMALLVAQMKNQDPTNPADQSEFLSQIAQFSMVNGIDDLGTSFNGLAGSMYTAQAMQASNLVGHDVLTDSNTAYLAAGGNVGGTIDVPETSEYAVMKVTNAAGEVVDSIDIGAIGAGSQRFAWSGFDSNDNALPEGAYSFHVEGVINGERVGIPVRMYDTVDGVAVDGSRTNVLLQLAGGDTVGLSQISEYK